MIIEADMNLNDISSTLMDIWTKYKDNAELAIIDINQLNVDFSKTSVYLCQINDLLARAEKNHMKAKQALKNLHEGEFFLEEREFSAEEYEKDLGPKPTDSYIKARAEKRTKDYRKILVKTYAELQNVRVWRDSTLEMINFFKKTLDVQRDEFNKAGNV